MAASDVNASRTEERQAVHRTNDRFILIVVYLNLYCKVELEDQSMTGH